MLTCPPLKAQLLSQGYLVSLMNFVKAVFTDCRGKWIFCSDFCATFRRESLGHTLWIFRRLEFLVHCGKAQKYRGGTRTSSGSSSALGGSGEFLQPGDPPLLWQNPVPSALCSLCHSWWAPGLWRNTWFARVRFSHGREAAAWGTHSLVESNERSRWENKGSVVMRSHPLELKAWWRWKKTRETHTPRIWGPRPTRPWRRLTLDA